ncbi:MAG: ABC transporter permease [Phycisphaeraceae bacterium]|nr:MAG: ABC transporter permease [Phycisphaeraceae bacterium]
MADEPSIPSSERRIPTHGWLIIPILAVIGRKTLALLEQVGGATYLCWDAFVWVWRALTTKRVRFGRHALVSQIVRVGVRSIFIVSLVSGVVGLILALQLAPPLDDFGRRDLVANIIGVAVFRELGPLIGAIVLTGFAGASIAAEIGTMVVSEEIEALEAHALNPVRFLVVPRVLASTLSMTALGVIASGVAVLCSIVISVTLLSIPYSTYVSNMVDQVKLADVLSGFSKGGVFGLLIGLIACYNGLKVTGGAAGVGNATTSTVVQCVVAIIFADLVFTAIFFALHLV